eukprot:COSAG06_NODE_18586_length_879_cov_0.993590_2_plen_201_part_00
MLSHCYIRNNQFTETGSGQMKENSDENTVCVLFRFVLSCLVLSCLVLSFIALHNNIYNIIYNRERRLSGAETRLFSHFYIKTIILPRPARDKHKETSKKRLVSAGESIWLVEFYAPWCSACQRFSKGYLSAPSHVCLKRSVFQGQPFSPVSKRNGATNPDKINPRAYTLVSRSRYKEVAKLLEEDEIETGVRKTPVLSHF